MKTKIIKSSELGNKCWSARRWLGGECKRLERCKYPEKETCKAYITKTVSYKRKKYAKDEK